MTNYEKNKAEIDKVWEAKAAIAVSNGGIKRCHETNCAKCDFFGHGNCATQTMRWLVAEYKKPQIDWSKIPIDAPILVRDREDHKWKREYFAKYENNRVYAWRDGRSSWTTKSQDDVVNWIYAKLAEGEE